MHKITIVNEVNGREYGATFSTKEELDSWKQEQIDKDSWGKKQRHVNALDLAPELEDRVISTTVIPAKEETELEPATEEIILKEVKCDYVITESNLNLSKHHRNAVKIDNRKSEYPSLEEILHVILDHGLESAELTDLQALRQSIKDKYPLES